MAGPKIKVEIDAPELVSAVIKQLVEGGTLVEVVRCEGCHFFERDHFENVDGIPVIVTHNICTRWGNGCVTAEDGYCFMGIRGGAG